MRRFTIPESDAMPKEQRPADNSFGADDLGQKKAKKAPVGRFYHCSTSSLSATESGAQLSTATHGPELKMELRHSEEP
eukprot:712146-Amphidinium_carterae.1